MAASDVVRKITIVGQTQGVDQATAALKGLAGAQDAVAVSSERATASQLSMQSKLNSIERSLDAEFRAQQQMARVERDLTMARQQGILTIERENELLALAAARYRATGEAAQGMAEAFKTAKEFATGLVLGLGAGVIFTGIAELPSKISEMVEQAAGIQHTADVLGLTTKNLQELHYAATMSDVSIESFDGALEKFSRSLGGAGSGAAGLTAIFKANHVAISGDLVKDFGTFADLIEHATTVEQRNALTMAAFGKSASDMGPMFDHGRAGIAGLSAEAEKAGAVLSVQTLQAAAALNDEFDKMKLAASTTFRELAVGAAPGIVVVMKGISAAASVIATGFDYAAKYVAVAGVGLAAYFGPATALMLWNINKALILGVVDGLKAVSIAALSNPLGLFIAGIASAVAAAFLFRDQIKSAIGVDVVGLMKDAANSIIGTFVYGFNAIKSNWSLLPSVLGDFSISTANAVISGIDSMLNSAVGLINAFIEKVNSIGGKLGINLGQIDASKIGIGQIANPYAGVEQSVAKQLEAARKSAFGTDYIGAIGGALSAGWDKVTGGGATTVQGKSGGRDTVNAATAAQEEQAKRVKEVTDALNEQLAALTQTDREQAISAELSKAKVTAASKEGQTITELAGRLYDQKKAIEAVNDAEGFFAQQMESAFEGIVTGSSSVTDAINSITKALIQAVIQAELLGQGPLAGILGTAPGTSGQTGGIFGSLLSAIVPSGGGFGSVSGMLYASGGYTGNMPTNQPAGIVHGGEFVINAGATAAHRGLLEAINAGRPGYASGGYVAPYVPTGAPANSNMPGASAGMSVVVNNYAGSDVETSTEKSRGVNGEQLIIGIHKKAMARGEYDQAHQGRFGSRRPKVT
jgi:hypothetical protein